MTEHVTKDPLEAQLVSLTRDLILIPSIPGRPEDRRRCFEFVKNHLETLETVEFREFEVQGIPSLVVTPQGVAKPKILMCGHLDVISHADISLYRSQIRDGRITGPGAGDMKGGLAILLEIFRHMHSKYPGISLGIAVTADEETGGTLGIGHLCAKEGLRCSMAMIPDGGSINEITVEEKGILHLRLSCHGHSGHAARPWQTPNPLEILMQRLGELKRAFLRYERKDDRWYPTCAVTMLGTPNQTINRIPALVTAFLDIRFPPPFTVEKILQLAREILGREIEVGVVISAEPTHLSPDPLYQQIIEEMTEQPAKLIRDDGGSDARFLAGCGIPVMMSRPLVGNLHAPDEWIDIRSMVLLYRIYEQYIIRKLL